MSEGSDDLHGHSRSTCLWARLGGFVLVAGFLAVGVLVDARNPPLTTTGAVLGAFFSAPLVAAAVAELMYTSAPNKNQIAHRFGFGRIGRLLSNILLATILVILSYLFIGLLISGVFVSFVSSIGLTVPADALLYAVSMVLGGLFVGVTGPLWLLNVSLKGPTDEDHATPTSESQHDGSPPDGEVGTQGPVHELRETFEVAEEEFEKGRHKQARLGVEQLESQLFEVQNQDSEARELEENVLLLKAKLLKADVQTDLRTAREAFEGGEIETAETTVEDLRKKLDNNTLDRVEIQDLQDEVEDLESKLEEHRDGEKADQRLVGMLGSIGAARSQAEDLLEEGNDEAAIERIESGLDTCETATELNTEHQLGREDRLTEIRAELEQLADQAHTESEQQPRAVEDSVQPNRIDELTDYLANAEESVSRGIDRRDTGDPDAAVEAFQSAIQEYESALQLAEEHDLPQQWEVAQRHSMVSEYLEITRDELDDQQRSVEHDLEQVLDDAESALVKVEQHREVDDTISAREALAEAVGYLDDATQLLESGVVSEHHRGRYEDLLDRADTLHGELPEEEDSKKYRTRDLVESLQVLASKLGESPRPEFVTAYGEYPAEAYLDEFGSWPEALAAANLAPIDEQAREKRTYSRLDILDALVDLADEFGHPPSKGEMNEQGEMSASPVQARFSDWETALDLAGVSEDGFDQQDDRRGSDSEDESVTSEASATTGSDETDDGDDLIDQLMDDMDLDTGAEKAHD